MPKGVAQRKHGRNECGHDLSGREIPYFLTGLVLAEAQVKKLVVPVFGLLLAACTYQFAPTATEDSRLIDPTTSGEPTATATEFDLTLPDTDAGFGPGSPGGVGMGGGPSAPDPTGEGGGGGMTPGLPDMPSSS